MKMSKIAMASALAMSLVTLGAQAANPQGFSQGQGIVNFKGIVIDAPCGIDPDSADQSIDFGQISKAHLNADGISIKKPVNIKLVNCVDGVTGLKKGVTVTWRGNSITSAPTELATAGGTNTSIVIDGYGKNVTFGTATDAVKLNPGQNTLHFTSWVKKTAAQASVNEGEFTAVANFNLAYE